MKICYVCGKKKVIWNSDFSFDECGYEGDGIVHNYTCQECGAEIEVRESFESEDNE